MREMRDEDIPLKDCSEGIQRRFEVARGLMANPRLLFLDEPTIGLDIKTKKTLWDYITKLRDKEEVTILLTTHYIEEVERLCDRVSIIDNGRIAAIDSPQRLKDMLGTVLVRVEVANGQDKDLVNMFGSLDGMRDFTQNGTELRMSIDDGERKIPQVLTFANQQGISVSSVESLKPSLEDAFLNITGKTIREG